MNERLALVVEDDKAMSLLYERVLKQANWEILKASNGNEAIDVLQEQTPRLIFLDMLLPYANGIKVLEVIANDARFDATQVVIVSASKEFEQYAQWKPGTRFILKPVLPTMIRDIVNGLDNPD